MMKLGAGSRQVVQSSPLIQVLEVLLLKVRAGVERERERARERSHGLILAAGYYWRMSELC